MSRDSFHPEVHHSGGGGQSEEYEGRAKKMSPSMAARKAKKRDAERKARKKSTLSKRRNRKNK